MDGRTDGWMDVCMDGWMDGQTDEWMGGWMGEQTSQLVRRCMCRWKSENGCMEQFNS